MRQTRNRNSTGFALDKFRFDNFWGHFAHTAVASVLLFSFICFDDFLQRSQVITSSASLFFSFGLIVVVAWLYRWWSTFYLLPGALLYEVYPVCMLGNLPVSQGLSALPALLVAPIGFAMIRWVGIETEIGKNHSVKIWRLILLGGVKTSIFAFLAKSAIEKLESWVPILDVASQELNAFPLVFMTEMAGLVTFMFVVMLVLKLTRKG